MAKADFALRLFVCEEVGIDGNDDAIEADGNFNSEVSEFMPEFSLVSPRAFG